MYSTIKCHFSAAAAAKQLQNSAWGLKIEADSLFFFFKFCRCHLLVNQKVSVFTVFRGCQSLVSISQRVQEMRSGQEGLNILPEAPFTRGIGCCPKTMQWFFCCSFIVYCCIICLCVCVCVGSGGVLVLLCST